MNQYCKTLVMGIIMMTAGLIALSTLSVSASPQDQAQNQSASDNMTAEGGNMTLQTEGTSGTNQSVARNESAGGGGMAPS